MTLTAEILAEMAEALAIVLEMAEFELSPNGVEWWFCPFCISDVSADHVGHENACLLLRARKWVEEAGL